MEFKLTEEQELIRKNMREFAERCGTLLPPKLTKTAATPLKYLRSLPKEAGWEFLFPQQYGGRWRRLL